MLDLKLEFKCMLIKDSVYQRATPFLTETPLYFNEFALNKTKHEILELLNNYKIIVLHKDIAYGLEYETLLEDHCDVIINLISYKNTADYYQDKVVEITEKTAKKIKHSKRAYSNDKIFEIPVRVLPQPAKSKPQISSSFNLETNDKQTLQKQELVLPYIEAQKGIIHYEPDTDDDWDDEDPDDDLDI